MSTILSRPVRVGLATATLTVLALATGACGQKGPLVMPVPPKPPGSTRTSPPSEPPVQVSEPPSPGAGQTPYPPPAPAPTPSKP